MFPTTLDALGVINYSGTGNQNILSPAGRSYGVLRISGSGIKSLTAATTILSDLFVDAGTLDILNYTFGRTGFGGTMNVANLATLKLSGSNFPANFATVDLGPNSTVNYYGAGQTVANVTKGYGNLSLTGNGLKDMPATSALVIAGYLEASGTGSPLTFEAKGSLAITGKVDLSGTASFNAGAFTHTVGGDWINNADFFGGTSTVILTGTGKKIERTLTTALSPTLRNEFYNLQVAGLGTTIKVPSAQSLTIRGNLETTGAGTLTQSAGD
ncbi:hypothetical protein [Pontibacter pudoricolor]|uniref:hypothetical protein n=1 Tax=Pontibacter pudoricolor TaxID=2694930 RepID=UPI001391AE6D|nr:hypothetical protein [Pontibacter pudoricolor]